MQRRDFITYSSLSIAGSFLIPSDIHAMSFTKDELKTQKTDILPKNAKFIWFDTDGEGRNIYSNFRKSFQISTKPEKAIFNIFADSSYQLFINGNFIEQGPVRFDPRFPVFDTHDIAKHLVIGENLIAIQANYFGMKTYKSIANRGGLLCWGDIKVGKNTISLNSNPTNWKVIKAAERSRFVQKLSFALNPPDVFEQSKEERNWKNIGFDDSKWTFAKEISNQKSWGEMSPRTIPFMSGKEVPIAEIKKVAPILIDENLYSFSIPFPELAEDNKSRNRNFYIAFYTWIYSEKNQSVSVGTFWGENWINGKELKVGVDSDSQSMRIIQQWELKKGWNHFFGKVTPYTDLLNQYFSFPKVAGLIVSAEKKLTNAKILFRRSPDVISLENFDKFLLTKSLPYSETENLYEVGGWIDTFQENIAQSPCLESSWDTFSQPIEKLKPDDLNNHIFKLENYPAGFSILIDLDFMHLSFPILDAKGVNGSTIDITYSEQLTTDNFHLMHTFNYQPGDRVICNQDTLKWMPSHPRGIRYAKLTFRNSQSDITINSFTIRSANYPISNKGSYSCSDTLLNEIWKMCKRTQEVNMEDAYVDCSGRERGMYLRDTIIQYYNNLAAFGDQALMRRCLELYLQSPDETGKFRAVYPNTGNYTIADFSLNALEGLRIYYENTGDKQLLLTYWDAIINNLKWFDNLSDERGDKLLDSEWHMKQKINAFYGGFHGDLGIVEGHMDITGIHCVFSCTYLIALQAALFLSIEIGKNSYADLLKSRINQLSESIISKFWNKDLGCFSDNLERTTHSIHASLFAVRAGLVDQSKLPLVKKYISEKLKYIFVNGYSPDGGVYCSPSFSFYIIDGLYKAGLEQVAEDIIKQGWGWCLFNGMKTTPEYFSKDPFQSMCHAWSASPVYFLSKYGLGINFPKAPDLSYVEIKVQTAYLTELTGSYPHPNGGLIEVKWHNENGKRVFDYVKVPSGVEMKIIG